MIPIDSSLFNRTSPDSLYGKRIVLIKSIENIKGQRIEKGGKGRILCKSVCDAVDIISDNDIMILGVSIRYISLLEELKRNK